jgi:hypothetical protein
MDKVTDHVARLSGRAPQRLADWLVDHAASLKP